MLFLTDQGKPIERWGRKVTGLPGFTPQGSGTAGSARVKPHWNTRHGLPGPAMDEEQAMNTQADADQIAFLQGTWQALLQGQPEPFDKTLLTDFVSNAVLGSLPPHTTLTNVLHECHAHEAFQESYIKSFLG